MNRFSCFFITLLLSATAFGNGDDWIRQANPKKTIKEKHSIQKMESPSTSQKKKKEQEKHFYEEKGMYRKQL